MAICNRILRLLPDFRSLPSGVEPVPKQSKLSKLAGECREGITVHSQRYTNESGDSCIRKEVNYQVDCEDNSKELHIYNSESSIILSQPNKNEITLATSGNIDADTVIIGFATSINVHPWAVSRACSDGRYILDSSAIGKLDTLAKHAVELIAQENKPVLMYM
ncbi:MAG: hypothetical protein GY861_07830 [bacterium]|nr:hypothetical protein [bacterium]